MNHLIKLVVISCALLMASVSWAAGNDMSKQAISERIAPAGKVAVVKVVAVKKVTKDMAASDKKVASTKVISQAVTLKRAGEIYKMHCSVCHSSGIAGAPKYGDAKAWSAKIAAKPGKKNAEKFAAIVRQSIKGVGAMPAKGTCASCTKAELAASINYMISSGQSISMPKK